jgi:hypothetical protein
MRVLIVVVGVTAAAAVGALAYLNWLQNQIDREH